MMPDPESIQVPPSPDVPDIGYRPNCPTCGLAPSRINVRRDGEGIHRGDYLCGEGHIWSTRWLVGA